MLDHAVAPLCAVIVIGTEFTYPELGADALNVNPFVVIAAVWALLTTYVMTLFVKTGPDTIVVPAITPDPWTVMPGRGTPHLHPSVAVVGAPIAVIESVVPEILNSLELSLAARVKWAESGWPARVDTLPPVSTTRIE